MLESFVIFTKGGNILWEYRPDVVVGQPIDHLIQEILLSEKQDQAQYIFKDYVLRWSFQNEYNLVFVSIQLRLLASGNVDALLNASKRAFVDHFKEELKNGLIPQDVVEFEKDFQDIVKKFETSSNVNRRSGQKQSQDNGDSNSSDDNEGDENDNNNLKDSTVEESSTLSENQPLTQEGLDARRLDRLARMHDKKRDNTKKTTNNQTKNKSNQSGKGKRMTKWDDTKLTKEERAALDFSEAPTLTQDISTLKQQAEVVHGEAPTRGEKYWDDHSDIIKKNDPIIEEASLAASAKSSVWGFLSSIVGSKTLTTADLLPVRKQLTDHLVKKNVAPHVADQLVSSVVTSLEGQTLTSFNTIYSEVRRGLEIALRRVLTPKKEVDILAGVAAAKKEGRPYSIVFCGVNGVGKSTSLAKIAAFFTAQDFKVGVAACDTFRSGAIEQLRTHCAALNIPLFDRGYGKDEASVAQDGILRAKKEKLDIILIDTAGRMQNNIALMKGLAKLMNINEPDLVLFVGEALVGNDGCDQLMNFNRALEENSGKTNPRLIDGIVLTKFDTIDDKVGTAISMTYSTGQPIVFVGVGQKYKDLKRPSPDMLIKALLQ